MTPGADRRRFWRWVAAAAATSAALRARFLATPLSADEAGALVAARSWAHGGRLYTDVFIDRPQGVIAAFGRWDAWVGGSPSSVRVLAIVAGISTVIGAALIARAVGRSWRDGAAAAWLVAVISSSAAIEGYAANGELLAGGFTVAAMAMATLVVARRLAPGWMVAAGLAAGTGATIKQSGLDVALAITAWLVIAAWRRWRPPRQVLVLLAAFALGAAVPVTIAAIHGASLGWSAYTYALFGFRAHARSALVGGQWHRLGLTTLVAAALLAPAISVAVGRTRADAQGWGRWRRPEEALVVAWLGAASLGFVTGGNYHRHYWIQLTFPICVLVALALARPSTADGVDVDGADLSGHDLRATLARVLALPLVISLVLIAAPGLERDRRIGIDAGLAAWVQDQSGDPRPDLLPLCGSVTYYVAADALPRYRYLWVDHVRSARGATHLLVDLLDDPDRPVFVAEHQPVERCDPSGRVQAALDRHYRPVAEIDGIVVLRAVSAPTAGR